MNGRDAYLDKYVTASVLSGALPILVESLRGVGFDLADEPEMFAELVRTVGWNLYDTFAQLYLKTFLSSEEGGLILPGDQLMRLIAFEVRVPELQYFEVAKSCDESLLEGKLGAWPFWVSDVYLGPAAEDRASLCLRLRN